MRREVLGSGRISRNQHNRIGPTPSLHFHTRADDDELHAANSPVWIELDLVDVGEVQFDGIRFVAAHHARRFSPNERRDCPANGLQFRVAMPTTDGRSTRFTA